MSDDPSWEDCVNAILIPGDPGAIDDAGFRWQNIFTALADVKHVLDNYVLSEDGWSGPAADAYKTAIGSVCKQIAQFIDDNSYINSKLFEASYNLKQAMLNMPIPEEMVPTILQKRQEFETRDAYWPVPQDAFLRDAMAKAQQQHTDDPNLHWGPDDLAARWNDWIHDNTGLAVAIYKDLDNRHGDAAATLPGGSTSNTSLGDQMSIPNLTHPGGTGNLGGANLGGGPHGPTNLKNLDPNDFNHDPYDPSKIDPTTGLSGVDGSEFTGAGGGGSGGYPGLGRTTSLGAGGGGAGAGGLSPAAAAAAMKGIGTPVSGMPGAGMGMAPGMMGGMGGAKPAGSRRPGLVGAGGGPGAGRGADDAHGTWLQEDDDVWGSDSGAAPPLLT
jgi:hypothetical protein